MNPSAAARSASHNLALPFGLERHGGDDQIRALCCFLFLCWLHVGQRAFSFNIEKSTFDRYSTTHTSARAALLGAMWLPRCYCCVLLWLSKAHGLDRRGSGGQRGEPRGRRWALATPCTANDGGLEYFIRSVTGTLTQSNPCERYSIGNPQLDLRKIIIVYMG